MKQPYPSRKYLTPVLIFFLFFQYAPVVNFAQTTRTVCSSGCNFTTLQAAITAASSGDIILLNVNGTWTEKNIALPEKSLTIQGLGKTTTILQSATSRASASGGRIFSYAAPAGAGSNSFVFEDMTIRYAYAPLTDLGSSQFQSVGGVFYASGTLKGLTVTANRVKFYANETTAGNNINSGGSCFYVSATGSGFTYNADLTMTDCDFDDNKTANSSGTSLSDGPCFNLAGSPNRLTANNCTFTNNNGYTRGGVVYVGSSWVMSFSNSLFDNNTCRNGDGGCIYARSGTNWALENCLFKNNSAVFVSSVNGNNGYGGVWLGKGGRIRNCTFYNNSAVKGGAVFRTNNGTGEELQIINCTFYGNSASSTGRTIQYGTAASASSFPLILVNNIITNGGGTASSEINFTLTYSQMTTNTKNYCNSISSDNASPGTTPVFDFTSGNSTLSLSSTLADNGGPTQTLALSAGSSMIDAGTHTSGATYDISVKDQRNYSRYDGGIDVGAYEYNGIVDNASTPSISYTAPGNTLSTTDRVISSTITDANGVYWYPQSSDLRPRIYFRKNSGSWNSNVGTLSTGDGTNGNWDFTISSAAMGGLMNGDYVYYYIVAQDVSTTPSIESSPAGVSASSVNSIVTPPSPNSYLIGGATLPVKLESFTVTKNNRNAIIAWTASEEQDLSRYELERKTGDGNWTTVMQVTANNARNYSLVDRNLDNNTYYYRLRSVDLDGKSSLSQVRQVRFDDSGTMLIYPNPAVAGSEISIRLEQAATLRLFTATGELLWQKKFPAGTQKLKLNNLASGMYRLSDGTSSNILVIQ